MTNASALKITPGWPGPIGPSQQKSSSRLTQFSLFSRRYEAPSLEFDHACCGENYGPQASAEQHSRKGAPSGATATFGRLDKLRMIVADRRCLICAGSCPETPARPRYDKTCHVEILVQKRGYVDPVFGYRPGNSNYEKGGESFAKGAQSGSRLG
jgi:hypothetical protein